MDNANAPFIIGGILILLFLAYLYFTRDKTTDLVSGEEAGDDIKNPPHLEPEVRKLVDVALAEKAKVAKQAKRPNTRKRVSKKKADAVLVEAE